ncbi:MAG: xanthine dehydrogenase family protein subunit M [Dehalococcoidia bacterium]|nr:xanthine dehydrogenase family protein subunit M [Dehalococcoidia bacterium]
MKPAPFTYFAPTSIEETIGLLQRYGDEAKILAGGQSLVPLLNMRLARPTALIDINRIPRLDEIVTEDDAIVVGARVTERQLERHPVVAERLPLLVALVKLIGHPQIRNRGTVCGSIAHGDPSAELPAGALALDATVTVTGPTGERTIAVDDFYLGYLATALAGDEMMTQVRFPIPAAGTGWSVQEVARRHGDFALVGAVALVRVEGGRIAATNVVSFGTGGRPLRFPEVEAKLVGSVPGEALFSEAAEAITELLDPDDDVHASAAYRRQVAGVLVRRALEEALRRCEGGSR